MSIKNTYKNMDKEKRKNRQAELHRRCIMLLTSQKRRNA